METVWNFQNIISRHVIAHRQKTKLFWKYQDDLTVILENRKIRFYPKKNFGYTIAMYTTVFKSHFTYWGSAVESALDLESKGP